MKLRIGKNDNTQYENLRLHNRTFFGEFLFQSLQRLGRGGPVFNLNPEIMDQVTVFQIFDAGQGKIKEARKLMHPGREEDGSLCHKNTLLALRKWFFKHASQVKAALQSGERFDDAKRCPLEKLVNDYTVTICEIDEKISKLPPS